MISGSLKVEKPEVAPTQEEGLLVTLHFMADLSVEEHTLSLALLRYGGIVDRLRKSKEQLLQPYRHRLSALQHLQRHGLLNSPHDQAPSHSSNPKGVVSGSFSVGNPRKKFTTQEQGKSRKEPTL